MRIVGIFVAPQGSSPVLFIDLESVDGATALRLHMPLDAQSAGDLAARLRLIANGLDSLQPMALAAPSKRSTPEVA